MSNETKRDAGFRNGLLLGAALVASVGIAIYLDRAQDGGAAALPPAAAQDPAVAQQQQLPPNHPPMGGEHAGAYEDGQALPPGHPPIDGDGAVAQPDNGEMPPGHPPTQPGEGQTTVAAGSIPPASGEGAVTVSKLIREAATFEGKKVRIAAKVLKATPNVMGKTWLHVGDGTGSADKGDHDLVVTTQAQPQVGDVVIIEGLVTRNKDLGSGYRYDVLVEEAQITPRQEG